MTSPTLVTALSEYHAHTTCAVCVWLRRLQVKACHTVTTAKTLSLRIRSKFPQRTDGLADSTATIAPFGAHKRQRCSQHIGHCSQHLPRRFTASTEALLTNVAMPSPDNSYELYGS